jgi:SAM-dependent methyltransferase
MTPELYERFEKLEDTHWWFEGRRRVLRQVLERTLLPRTARRLLDVGSGTGGMYPMLSTFGEVTLVESSADARARAARRFPQATLFAGSLPDDLPQGTWDVVTAFDVLEHLEAPIEALRSIRARLVYDGQVVVTVPAFQFLWSQHDVANQHFRRYSKTQLVSHLSSAGFRVTLVSYYNTLLFPAVASARFLERLFPSRFQGESDLDETKEPLNRALQELFALERWAVGRVSFPFGVSLVAVAQRG